MKVSQIIRIIATVFVISLICIVLLIASFFVERSTLKNKEALRAAGIQLSSASDLLTNEARCYVQYGDKVYYDNYMREIEVDKNREKAVEALKKNHATKTELALVQQAADYSNTLAQLETEAFEAVTAGDLEKARELMFGSAYVDGKAPITSTMNKFQQELDTRTTKQANLAMALTTVMILLTAASMVVMMFTIIRCLKKIDEKLVLVSELADDAAEIAKGNISIKQREHREDEIGVLADAFSNMVEAIQKQADFVGLLAGGDYTRNIEVRSEHDSMNLAINNLVDAYNSLMSEIRSATTSVAYGSKAIADSSQMLAEAAVKQADDVEGLSTSVVKVSERIIENAKMASQAATLAGDIQESAEKGSLQMTEMIDAVKEINEASQDIQAVIKTIDDIASKTNLLALNAAIEAARAGEQGKGFAVVADEVRELAAKSAAAAKDTATLIVASIEKAKLGTRIADETSASFVNIVDGIKESASIVTGIAKVSDEQASAIQEINRGIEMVSKVIQENTAAAEQSAATAQEMNAQSFTLETMVGKFKLK